MRSRADKITGLSIPGNVVSCQPDGSVSDWKLCRIFSSKGRGGWKKSEIMLKPVVSTWSAWEEPANSGAKGSTGPTGANVSKDRAVSRGGGDSEAVVSGDG